MRTYRNSSLPAVLAIVLGIVLVGVLTWANYRYSADNPGGNDFLVHWVGTRAFLIDGVSPYSDEVAERIQTITYGRPARAGEHELRVAYPLYSTFVFAPFALISDFAMARAVWMTVLEIGLGVIAFISLRLTRWKPNPAMLVVFLLFSFLWYHSFRPLINGNAVILVTVWMYLAVLAIESRKDELAGILLGLATIKPQVVLLFFIFLLFWGFSSRRWKLVAWMVGTVAALTLVTTLILPDWLLQNLREVIRYPSYNPPGTPGAAFAEWWPTIGKYLGWGLTFVMALTLAVEWLAGQRKSGRALLWVICLTLVISQWSGIQTDPGNFIVLFLPLTLIFTAWIERWRKNGQILTLTAMGVLFAGLWALFLTTLQTGYQPVQNSVMFFPLPAFILFSLYWVRWWAVQPPSLWVDQLVAREHGS